MTFYGSASMPGGTSTLQVTGASSGVQHIAAFSLSTQVTTFQVTSATGGAIVHNDGQQVNVVHTVPAGNAPTVTTCDTGDPNVTCSVVSTAPGSVTLGISASRSAVHGARLLRLNGTMDLDGSVVDELPSLSSAQPGDIPAGTQSTITLDGSGLEGSSCSYCSPVVLVFDEFDNPVSWASGGVLSDTSAEINANPPVDAAGSIYYANVNVCGWALGYSDSGDAGGIGCNWNVVSFEVDAAQQPQPVITSVTPARGPVGASVDVVIQGSGFAPIPTINASGIAVAIISSTAGAIHATFAIPVSQPGGNAGVTVTVGGQTSAPASFYVQVPTSLARQTYPGDAPAGARGGLGPLETPDGTAGNNTAVNAAGQVVDSPVCGVYRNLAYVVVDQETPAQLIQGLSNIGLTETFSGFSGVPPAPGTLTESIDLVNCPGGIGSGQCAADVIDFVALFGDGGACLAAGANQSFIQGVFSDHRGLTGGKSSS